MSEPSYGLLPRPEPDPLVVSLVSAAVEELYRAAAAASPDADARQPAWRFSGRWWMKPSPLRRERPWARG